MSSTPRSPNNEKEWLDFFCDKPIPVRASTVVRLRKALESSSSNLLSLSPIIRSDPLMVFQVTRSAQALLTGKSAKVASIDHAIQTLGFDRIGEILSSVDSFKLNPFSTVHTMFMRAVADSHHAATQATKIAQLKHQQQFEEIKLAALLYGSVHWLAWLYAPLHKEAYQRKVLQEGIDVALAEFDVFGCTLQAVGHRLAEQMNLPELTVTALSHDTSPSSDLLSKLHMKAMGDPRLEGEDLREINHFFQQPYFIVKISNWLALTATRGWNTHKAKRLYEIMSDYLGMDKDATLAHLHSQCAQSAREYAQPGVMSPASELILMPSEQSNFLGKISDKEKTKLSKDIPRLRIEKTNANRHVKTKKETINASDDTLRSDYLDPQLFKTIHSEYISLGKADSKHFLKPGYIVKQLQRGLVEGLGLKRVLVLQVDNKNHLLKPLSSSGFDADDPLKSFSQDLKIPSIFKRLASKATFIWFSGNTRQRLSPLLPSHFEQIMPINDWLLMSLFEPKGPLVMIYADCGHDALPINSFLADRFRFLCTAANQALKNLP